MRRIKTAAMIATLCFLCGTTGYWFGRLVPHRAWQERALPDDLAACCQSCPTERNTQRNLHDPLAMEEPEQRQPTQAQAKEGGLHLCIGATTTFRPQSQLIEFMTKLAGEVRDKQATKLVVWQSQSASHNTAERETLQHLGFQVSRAQRVYVFPSSRKHKGGGLEPRKIAVTAAAHVLVPDFSGSSSFAHPSFILLDVFFMQVYTNPDGYPELEGNDLKLNFGDALERVRWRSKHALDYSNVLTKCYEMGAPYILIIEDDLQPAKDLDLKIRAALADVPDPNFGFIALYSGSITGHTRKGLRALTVKKPMDWSVAECLSRAVL